MGLLPQANEINEAVETETATEAVETTEAVSEPTESSTETTEASAKEIDDAPKNESTRDTVKRAFERLKKGDGDTGPKAEKAQKEPGKQDLKPEDVAKDLEIDPELLPPERLNSVEKQMFSNLPKGLKRAFTRSIKNLEGMTTREKQDYARATSEARSVVEAVMPYASKWGEQGFTVPSAIAALAAAQERLTNPETSVSTYIKMGKDLGINFEELAQVARGEMALPTKSAPQIEGNPQFRALHDKVESLYSNLEQQRAQPIVAEFQSVQNEVDPATGDYRYPELHDDSYLERLKPLVSNLIGTVPGIGYGDALKRAHFMVKGISPQSFGNSVQAQTRLPAANTQTHSAPQRAVSAAVTVRGKTAPVSASGPTSEPPPEALRDARATTRWALEQLRNGTAG